MVTITTPVSRIRAAARSCTRVRCCATSRAVIVTSSRSLSTSCRVMKKLPVALRFGATTPSRPTACSFERADDRQPRTNSIRVKKAPMTPNRIIGAIVRRACSHPGCTARERCRWRDVVCADHVARRRAHQLCRRRVMRLAVSLPQRIMRTFELSNYSRCLPKTFGNLDYVAG